MLSVGLCLHFVIIVIMASSQDFIDMRKEFSTVMNNFHEQLESASSSQGNSFIQIEKDFALFRSRFEGLLDRLCNRIDVLECQVRKNTVLIHGVPEQQGENVLEVVTNFFNKELKPRDLVLSKSHIDYCYRLRGTAGKQRPVLVKFASYWVKSDVWFAKKQLKGKPFSLSESLTHMRSRLLKEVKDRFGYRSVWTGDGNIFVCLPNKKKVRIANYRDFESAVGILEGLKVDTSDAESVKSVKGSSKRTAGVTTRKGGKN